jgi:hypothetical protein
VLHEISKINVCKEDKCLKNICSFIDNNTKNFDFIGIQEYSNIPKMREYSKELIKMSVTHDEVPEYLKSMALSHSTITKNINCTIPVTQ